MALHDAWYLCETFATHARNVCKSPVQRHDILAKAESQPRLGRQSFEQSRSKEAAEAIHVEVLELQKEVLGEKYPETLVSMTGLASIYHQQGRPEEPEAIQVDVLELRKAVLGETHPDTV